MKEQFDEWIQQGIIEPANSPWASPLVPVKKNDGRTRCVTDLRLLNDVTVKLAYPLTNIQENLHKLKHKCKNPFLERCMRCISLHPDRGKEPGTYSIYKSLWNFSLYLDAFWLV